MVKFCNQHILSRYPGIQWRSVLSATKLHTLRILPLGIPRSKQFSMLAYPPRNFEFSDFCFFSFKMSFFSDVCPMFLEISMFLNFCTLFREILIFFKCFCIFFEIFNFFAIKEFMISSNKNLDFNTLNAFSIQTLT